MEQARLKKDYKPYICMSLFLLAFAITYAVNLILPAEKTILLPFDNSINARAWTWLEILISAVAAFYIFKTRKFTPLDLVVGVILGVIVKYAGWYGYTSGIATVICYYSGCQIFRKYKQQDKYFNMGVKKILKSLLLGSALAIPFAIVNSWGSLSTLNYSTADFGFTRILRSAAGALPPGISEEVIFHFFLLAFATEVFGGSIPKKRATLFLVYFMCVVPHVLVHLPSYFTQSPVSALISAVWLSLLFGTPMVWLIRNKNLQTSMAFHWFIDFLRLVVEV